MAGNSAQGTGQKDFIKGTMKILQILPSLEVGGVERGVIDLVREMKHRGEKNVVISSGGKLVKELQKMGIPHYTLPVHKKSIFSLRMVSEIAKVIEREQIDIVHARSRVPAWLAWMAARKTRTPFMTTCHGYYSTHLLSRIMGWGERVIVISRIIGRHMIDDFKVSPDRIRLVHRGVDLSQFQFQPKKEPRRGRPLRIINVGRFTPIKGQVEFLKAVHLLRHDEEKIEVWLVGSGDLKKKKYTEKIQETIKQLGMEQSVKLLGTRRDVPELMAQADLLVVSTLVPEAFGRVVIEAGAVGTPVVATKAGGILDIIDDGENGILVAPGDIQAMADGMREILCDETKSEKFIQGLRKKVENCFSLDLMTDKTVQVYRELQQKKKILFFKLGAAGDIILAVPSLRMIRKKFPQAYIGVMVDRKWTGLLSDCPYVNEVIPVDRRKLSRWSYLLKMAARIRREHYDLSIDLQNSKWTHLLAWLSGIQERHGFRRGWAGKLLNSGVPYAENVESPVENQFHIISKVGVRECDSKLELWASPESEQKINKWMASLNVEPSTKLIGFAMGSSSKWPSKRWPLENFEALAERLLKNKDCRIICIGAHEDLPPESRPKWLYSKYVVNLLGETSLADLVALSKRLSVMVTGDTAPLHVAGAAGISTIALFGPTNPKRHLPPGAPITLFYKSIACQPCYRGDCGNSEKLACLKQISVDEVFDAVQKCLNQAERVKL